MIQNVQITMLVLITNVWIPAVFQSLVENKQFVKLPLIDQFAAAHLIGLAIPMKSVINVGFYSIKITHLLFQN